MSEQAAVQRPVVVVRDGRVCITHPGGSHHSWEVDTRFVYDPQDAILFREDIALGDEWNAIAVLLVTIDGQVILSWETLEDRRHWLYFQWEHPIHRCLRALKKCTVKAQVIHLEFVDGDELDLHIDPSGAQPLRLHVQSTPLRHVTYGASRSEE